MHSSQYLHPDQGSENDFMGGPPYRQIPLLQKVDTYLVLTCDMFFPVLLYLFGSAHI